MSIPLFILSECSCKGGALDHSQSVLCLLFLGTLSLGSLVTLHHVARIPGIGLIDAVFIKASGKLAIGALSIHSQ